MHSPAILRALISLLSISVLASTAAESDLRYNFQPGTTNGFRVSIESASEQNPRRFEGVILVGIRSVEQNVATVFFRGRLQSKRVPNAAQQFDGPMFHPHHFGQSDPWFQILRAPTISSFSEAQIDSHGRTLLTAGLFELPRPLENYAALLFPTLPVGRETTTENTVVIDEEPSGPGPQMHGGFHPGARNVPGRLTGIRKDTSSKLEPTNGLSRFSREIEFNSFAKTDDEPRLAMKSKAEAVLDPSTGLLHSLKLEGSSISANLDLRRKFGLIVTVEKIVGEELARAINDAAERKPNLTEAEVEVLLAHLQENDQQKRTEAAQRLFAAHLDQHAKRLLPIMIPLLNDNDHMVKMLAGRVLALAATEEHLPILHRILKQEDMSVYHEAIRALGRIGHKDSIQPLADVIAYGKGDSHSAAQALGEYGSAAEDAALALLNEKHLETRRHACQILNRAGTTKSIKALQEVITASDPQIVNEASMAVRAIRERGESAAKLIF